MKRDAISILVVLCLLTMTGCAAVIAGAGAGAGVYTYGAGDLRRTYSVDFDTAIRVASQAMADLKISVTERSSTGIEATLSGIRTDETPVTVTVLMIRPEVTEISVRTGLVGYWDKPGSELIHAAISKRMP